jgi:hypothetical protein
MGSERQGILVSQFEWWHWDVSSAGDTERKTRLTEVGTFV